MIDLRHFPSIAQISRVDKLFIQGLCLGARACQEVCAVAPKSNHSHGVFAAWHFVDLKLQPQLSWTLPGQCGEGAHRAPHVPFEERFYLCIVHQPNVSNVISKKTAGGKSEMSRKVAQFGPDFTHAESIHL